MSDSANLSDSLAAAVERGDLLPSSADNIDKLLRSPIPLYREAIGQLADAGEWGELNDRFYKQLAFGTGGLRGRTIGRVVSDAERGTPNAEERPEHPCVGTNTLNFYNLSRATQGLINYVKSVRATEGLSGNPSLALATDTRHFNTDFASFVAKVATENGCDVFLFSEPRSTPELSYVVRHLGLSTGIVLTASHNPPHDNGYKAYWSDGAQMVEPHAGGVIAEVEKIADDQYQALPADQQGALTILGEEIDDAYMDKLETILLDPQMVHSANDLKIVFTNIHGTGGKIVPQMLRRLGFDCSTVTEQDIEDGRFPTVESPNPENAPALAMAIDQAKATGSDIVIGTDPDADRMGVAARNASGELQLLTGNQIGSLIAWYRIDTLFRQGVLTDANKQNATLIKTFVTTELQRAIAERYGIGCIDTLTGFKYIGQKLNKYEAQIPAAERENYRQLSEAQTRDLRLEHSKFFVFGGEESYGYLGSDFLRDKDANGAAVMFGELAAYAKSNGLTLPELLDRVYCEYGYFIEELHSLVLEGAEGAAQIARLAKSYSSHPPTEVDGSAVSGVRDFATQEIIDPEGDRIPTEKMLIVELEGGRSFAVRPSGTEPKIKYYLFGQQRPAEGANFSDRELDRIKTEVAESLTTLWAWLDADIKNRLG